MVGPLYVSTNFLHFSAAGVLSYSWPVGWSCDSVLGVCHLLWPVCQLAACPGDDRHPGPRDIPGLVPAVCRVAAPTTCSGTAAFHYDEDDMQLYIPITASGLSMLSSLNDCLTDIKTVAKWHWILFNSIWAIRNCQNLAARLWKLEPRCMNTFHLF